MPHPVLGVLCFPTTHCSCKQNPRGQREKLGRNGLRDSSHTSLCGNHRQCWLSAVFEIVWSSPSPMRCTPWNPAASTLLLEVWEQARDRESPRACCFCDKIKPTSTFLSSSLFSSPAFSFSYLSASCCGRLSSSWTSVGSSVATSRRWPRWHQGPLRNSPYTLSQRSLSSSTSLQLVEGLGAALYHLLMPAQAN